MALGFSPLASGALGASPQLKAQATRLGSIQVPVLGFLLTTSLGSAGGGVQSKNNLADSLVATGTLGLLGSISATSPKMTTFAQGLQATGQLGGAGVAVGGRSASVIASGLQATGQCGAQDYAGASTVTPAGVEATGQVGDLSADSTTQWIEVAPSSTPGWQDVNIHMHIPT